MEQYEDEQAEAQEAAGLAPLGGTRIDNNGPISDQVSQTPPASHFALVEVQKVLRQGGAAIAAQTGVGAGAARIEHRPQHSTAHVVARTMQRALARHQPAPMRAALLSGLAELLPLWSASQAARGIGLALPLLVCAYGMVQEGAGCQVASWARKSAAAFEDRGVRAGGGGAAAAATVEDGCVPQTLPHVPVARIIAQHLLCPSVGDNEGRAAAPEFERLHTLPCGGLSCLTVGYVLHLLCSAVLLAVLDPTSEVEGSEEGTPGGRSGGRGVSGGQEGINLQDSSSKRNSLSCRQAVADRCAQHVLAAVQRWLPAEAGHAQNKPSAAAQPVQPVEAGEAGHCGSSVLAAGQRWTVACVCLRNLLCCAGALQSSRGVEAAPLQVALLLLMRVVVTPPLLLPRRNAAESGGGSGAQEGSIEMEGALQCFGVEDCLTMMGCSYLEVLHAVRAVLQPSEGGHGNSFPGGVRSLKLAAVEMAEDFFASQGGNVDAIEQIFL